MAPKADYYTLLGVPRKAGNEEIKKAYRRLAVQWHPDRNPGSRLAEERFKAIAEAYAVLSSPLKRRQYDLLGPAEFNREFSHDKIFQGFEPGDFFKSFGLSDARDTLNRIFSKDPAVRNDSGQAPQNHINEFFMGFGQKGSAREARSPDIHIPLMISLKEALTGTEKYVAYNTPSGSVKVLVHLPAGLAGGHKVVVQGQGPAQAGGLPGDVVVTVNLMPEPGFIQRGSDIVTNLELTDTELQEGCRPTVTAPAGQTLRLRVPPKSLPGATFRMPGYGLNRPDGSKGDLLVQVKKKF